MSLYAYLMLISFTGPFILSFDKKVAFYKWWKPLFVGIFFNAVLFILWDAWFTRQGIWSFNNDYVWSCRLYDLPIEEWSFFVVVPYASVFIYACIKHYVNVDFIKPFQNYIQYVFMLMCLMAAVVYYDKTYTLVNSLIALLLLLFHTFYLKKSYMAYFWVAYFVHLIPFFIVNGILTGMATPSPVVIYNSHDIIGWRISTIPIEDSIYALICLLIPISIMEAILEYKEI
jgi:lycopene cyclase domain-containing protein